MYCDVPFVKIWSTELNSYLLGRTEIPPEVRVPAPELRIPCPVPGGTGGHRGDTGGTPKGDTQVASKQLNRGRKRAIGLLADSPVSAQYLGQFVFIWPRRGTCTYSVTSSVKQENTVSE